MGDASDNTGRYRRGDISGVAEAEHRRGQNAIFDYCRAAMPYFLQSLTLSRFEIDIAKPIAATAIIGSFSR